MPETSRIASSTLTEPDTAAYIGMSRAFLRAARTGRGTAGPPYIKIGRSVRYLVADLDAWVTAHRVGTRDGR